MRPALTILLRLYPSEFRHAYGRLIELQVRERSTYAITGTRTTRIVS